MLHNKTLQSVTLKSHEAALGLNREVIVAINAARDTRIAARFAISHLHVHDLAKLGFRHHVHTEASFPK